MDSNEYSEASGDPALVGVGDYQIVHDDYSVLQTDGVFTCVAVGLYDEDTCVRGLMHANTPGEDVGGVNRLLDDMTDDMPSDPDNWQAYIVGGGFDPDHPQLGMRNGNSAKSWLEEFGVDNVETHTGGELKRDTYLLPSGELEVEEESLFEFNRRDSVAGRNLSRI